MVKVGKKRQIKNIETKKVVTTVASIARGHATYVDKNKLLAISSVRKPLKEGPNKLENIVHVLEKKDEDYSYFQENYLGINKKIDVVLKYKDRKSKEGKYANEYDNLPLEIVTLSGKTLYLKDILER